MFLRRSVTSSMYTFLNKVFSEARPPVIYLVGRSGHGKSSLINALSNSNQAKVGHIAPTTAETEVYDISFQGHSGVCKIVDSRGLYEATYPEGATLQAAEQIKLDLQKQKPDIILHLVTCTEVRNLANDMQFFNNVYKRIKWRQGKVPPVISVLTKADLHYHHCRWPIEDHKEKQQELEKLVLYMSKDVLNATSCTPLQHTAYYYGCSTKGCETNVHVIPVVSVAQDQITRWNIDKLRLLIGQELS